MLHLSVCRASMGRTHFLLYFTLFQQPCKGMTLQGFGALQMTLLHFVRRGWGGGGGGALLILMKEGQGPAVLAVRA